MTRKLVLFDIDGTILLTAGAGRRAIVAALAEEVGPTPAFERIRFDGKTDPQIVAEMLEAAGQPEPRESPRVRALCERYVGFLARELERPTDADDRHARSATRCSTGSRRSPASCSAC